MRFAQICIVHSKLTSDKPNKCQRLIIVERNERTALKHALQKKNNFISGNVILRTNSAEWIQTAQQNVKLSISADVTSSPVINIQVHLSFLPLLILPWSIHLVHCATFLATISFRREFQPCTLSLPFRSGCRATLLSKDSISQLLQ